MKTPLRFTIDKDFLPGKALMEYMENDGLFLATLEIGDVKTVFKINGKCIFNNKMKNPHSDHLLVHTSELDDEDRKALQKIAFSYPRAIKQLLESNNSHELEKFKKGHKSLIIEENVVDYQVYLKEKCIFFGNLNAELKKGYKPNDFSILPSLSEAFMTVAGVTVFGLYQAFESGNISDEDMSIVYDIMKYKGHDIVLEDSFSSNEILDELNLLNTKAHTFSEEEFILYRKVGQFSQNESLITIIYKIDEEKSTDSYSSHFDEMESVIEEHLSSIIND